MIHFVGKENESLLVAELDDIGHVVETEYATGGISWIDHDHRFENRSLLPRLFHSSFQPLEIERPIVLLVEVVRHGASRVEGERGGVERILGNRNENTVEGRIDEDLHEIGDSRRCSSGDVDLR